MAGAIRPEDRPVSPFLTVWRWHITMAASILHRVTGVALYGGVVLFALWLMAVAAGPEAYRFVGDQLAQPLGQIALYLLGRVARLPSRQRHSPSCLGHWRRFETRRR